MPFQLPTKIDLEIVTPETLIFSGEVQEVVVPGLDGALGILPGHAPMLSELGIGVLSFRSGGEETHFYCCDGFVEVLGSRVSVLAETILAPRQIDASEAEADRQKAHADLRSTRAGTDYEGASLLLRQAEARLETLAR